MPCSDGGTYCSEDTETKNRLDKVTRLLCGLCERAECEARGTLISNDEELAQWWAKHQEEDLRREEQERKEREEKEAKRKALAKLSPRERRLLGLLKNKELT